METITVKVSDTEAGERLDKVLAAGAAGLSRARLQSLIESGCVRCGGTVVAGSSRKTKAGEVYEIDVPPPEELQTQFDLIQSSGLDIPDAIRKFWARERPLEVKPVDLRHYVSREKLPPYQNVWVRMTGEVPDDRKLQSAILAYLSDMTLLDTSTFPHGRSGFDPQIQMASLDHAMWFHRAHALDDWLLYTADSPNSIGSRGFARGALYARDGTLIASTAQEGLVRLRSKPSK